MNILCLGGNGYLGSKVTRRLIQEGHSVVCTKRVASDLSRLSDIRNQVIWIPATIEAVDAAMQYSQFDYVLNMACNYGRSNVLYDDVLEANIEFPLKVLNAAVENGTRHFLTIGTGLPDGMNMYSFSKKMFSDFGRFYVNNHDIDFNCLLLEMFYGADEPSDRFLPSIIRKMIKGQDVEVTLGTQHRDIISIEDIVDAIMKVIERTPRGFNEIPIGTGEAPTISEIVDFIWEQTGKKSRVNKGAIPLRRNEPDCVANTSIMKSIAIWNPIEWKMGIKSMIAEIERMDMEE